MAPDDQEDGEPELSAVDDPPGTLIHYWRRGFDIPAVYVRTARRGGATITVRPVDGKPPWTLNYTHEDAALRRARRIAEGKDDGRDVMAATAKQAHRPREAAGP